MKLTAITLILSLLISAAPSFGHDPCDKTDCAAVKAKIRTIEAKMRSGYSHAQGERYERQLRELRDKRYRICR